MSPYLWRIHDRADSGVQYKFPPFLTHTCRIVAVCYSFLLPSHLLLPAIPRRGAQFIIDRNASPSDFKKPDNQAVIIDQQQVLCVILCRILLLEDDIFTYQLFHIRGGDGDRCALPGLFAVLDAGDAYFDASRRPVPSARR